MAALASEKNVESCSVLARLVPAQTFLVHKIHFLGYVYKDATLFKKCQHISFLKRSDKLRGYFYGMEVRTLRVPDTSTRGVTVKNSEFTILVLGRVVSCSDNWQEEDFAVLLYVSDPCRLDRGTVRGKDLRGGSNAGNCRYVLKAG